MTPLRWMIVAALLLPRIANADYLEVLRSSEVYQQPSHHSVVISSVVEGVRLELDSPVGEDNGCYRVVVPGKSEPGWIYRNRVWRHTGDIGHNLGSGVASPEHQNVVSTMCIEGCPRGAPADDTLVVRDIYILSNNPKTKFADWVSYRLDPDMIDGPPAERKWQTDDLLPDDETLNPRDYRNAREALKVDRGHQAPLADFRGTKYVLETNVLSNITPQASALNQGAWKISKTPRGNSPGRSRPTQSQGPFMTPHLHHYQRPICLIAFHQGTGKLSLSGHPRTKSELQHLDFPKGTRVERTSDRTLRRCA